MYRIMYSRLIILLSIVCFSTTLFSQDMDNHLWQNRVLVIQSSDIQNEFYINQLSQFIDQEKELADRKMIIYELINNQYRLTDYSKTLLVSEWKSLGLKSMDIRGSDDFKVTLLGLDGEKKLEQNELLKAKELYRIIDSMPMRQSELRSKRNE